MPATTDMPSEAPTATDSRSGSPAFSLRRPAGLSHILLLLGRVILAVILLYAGFAKLRPVTVRSFSPASVRISLSFFAMQVDSYQLLPAWAVSPVAHIVPFLEVGLGALLLTGWQLPIFSSLATALLAVFFAVVVRSYAMGLQINCGCFGPGETLTIKTVARDAALLALAVAVTVAALLVRHRRFSGPMPPAGNKAL